MTKIINANSLEIYTNNAIDQMVINNYKGRKPKLCILVASDDKASERYVNNKVKMGEEFRIDVEVIKFGLFVNNIEIADQIDELNNDDSVDGIILQLPVFEHLDEDYLIHQISPYKDVDGLTNYSKLLLDKGTLHKIPCTPLGVVDLLTMEGVLIPGKNVVVVGKGATSGAPMATLFRNYGATVTVCHSKTPKNDLEFYVRHADIVISCVGKRDLLNAEWFKEDSIVIGVGLSYDENGKQHLDFDVEKVVEFGKAKLVSQRTNCTGKATVISLMYNTALAYLGEL